MYPKIETTKECLLYMNENTVPYFIYRYTPYPKWISIITLENYIFNSPSNSSLTIAQIEKSEERVKIIRNDPNFYTISYDAAINFLELKNGN